ncbi:hypothetical protein DW905_12435 [Faecalibacterium prausnitzii]|uniref:Uncharacterized protein n=1 Tax=Faecalibacterium prausnitzii TaxID=853 RepID=A0A3E2V177_9FIRM|nr:hypothetical protein DW905_12435 [Faecalibacterium prausnitzii]
MKKNHRLRSVVLFVLLALCGMVWYTRLSSTTRNLYIKENIDETVFMFALFKCRKSDKGRN